MDQEEAHQRREEERDAIKARKAQGHTATKATVPVQKVLPMKLADDVPLAEVPPPMVPPPACAAFNSRCWRN